MKMPRPTDDEKDQFRALIGNFPEATVKPMFGNFGAFVNGTMFAGLLGSVVGVRLLDEELREQLRGMPGTIGWGPGGSSLREYVGLPLTLPEDDLTEWLGVAYLEMRARPPQPTKKRRAKS